MPALDRRPHPAPAAESFRRDAAHDLVHRARNLDTLWPIGSRVDRLHRNGAMFLIVLALHAEGRVAKRDLALVLNSHCDELPIAHLSEALQRVEMRGDQLLDIAQAQTPRSLPFLRGKITPETHFSGTIPEVVERILDLVHESRQGHQTLMG